eukprot:Seg1720.2 transcript_id=Seg1720.2/GoldUCD/mRNA.D3Y31 product="Zinc metalloproteinase nas-15" protein_id=Seg1720.2/GoldUCD/D3Y31
MEMKILPLLLTVFLAVANSQRSAKPCRDLRRDCKRFRDGGWCTRRSRIMKKICPKSCGMCEGDCMDLRDDCELRYSFGYCKDDPYGMSRICAKTCRFCKPNKVTTRKSTTTTPATTTTTTTTTEAATTTEATTTTTTTPKPTTQAPTTTTTKTTTAPKPIVMHAKRQKAACLREDKLPKVRCQYYKYVGWCEKRKRTKYYCYRTCVCDLKPSGPACKSSTYGCCWDNKTTKLSASGYGCPACKDDPRFSVLCIRFQMDCAVKGGLGRSLREYCKSTCKIC